MNIDDIILAIEAERYDFPNIGISGVQEIRTEELVLRISDSSSSVFTNSVARSIFSLDADEKIRNVIELYESKNKSFSWWVGPKSQPNDLSFRLKSLGFTLEDVYIGLATPVDQVHSHQLSPWSVEEAQTESDIRDHVSVSASVWGMDSASVEAAVRERIFYVSVSDGRGGYIVARNNEGQPIGNGTYRISSDGRSVYLMGSAVLLEYRNQGVYHALLQYRFEKAKKAGCELVTVQARVGTSEPILRRLGFQEYCRFEMLVLSF